MSSTENPADEPVTLPNSDESSFNTIRAYPISERTESPVSGTEKSGKSSSDRTCSPSAVSGVTPFAVVRSSLSVSTSMRWSVCSVKPFFLNDSDT
ncbi:hypothetical protein [Paraburkholderia panacisoli]|uniref:hypothetical protein n=1 Tax=Paraburkholderia panacisoli TaxID=2603818 RepID=UPI00165F0D40|nr:hypothetical protein [Paraburkholderia panacisoli]